MGEREFAGADDRVWRSALIMLTLRKQSDSCEL